LELSEKNLIRLIKTCTNLFEELFNVTAAAAAQPQRSRQRPDFKVSKFQICL
jgi:hypothetical protein